MHVYCIDFNGESSEATSFDVHEMTYALCCQLHSVLQQNKHSWSQILSMKIFYNQFVVDKEERLIQSGLHHLRSVVYRCCMKEVRT